MRGPSDDDAPEALTTLTPDELVLRQTVREFADRAVRPLVADMDRQAALPRTLIDELFALGVMGIMIPEAFGGAGGRLFHSVIAVEELSRVDPSVGVLVDVQNTLVGTALDRWGTPEMRARYLPSLATRDIGAYALSEAGSGSDAFALQTRAVTDGGTFRISGRKLWITNAVEATVFIVFATIDPDAGHRGVTAFVVPRETPGLSIGHKEDKMGIRASSTAEVVLDDCRVTPAAVLGEVGRGYRVAIETLNEGRIGIGAQMVGLAAGALDAALRHTRERHQFGRAVVEFQAVQFQLARAAMEIESARLLVYNAARLRDRGAPFLAAAAMAKLHASEVAERAASLAVNLCGGTGFVKGSPVEKFYRDAKIGQIYEGTSNMQLQTIAKELLKS
ncbi:MAG: acyl-CoA dehydrogenase family protein [Acidobacteriota bacterium]